MAEGERKALIVGAGIGGLATALALQKAGWKVEVLERSGTLESPGTGLSLWPNALAALERLGVLDNVLTAAVPVRGDVLDMAGEPIMLLEQLEVRRRYGLPIQMIHRSDLTSILARPLKVNTVHLGLEVTGFELGFPRSSVQLNTGGRKNADLVVGADGLYSVVRTGLVGGGAPRSSGTTALRGICPAAGLDHGSVPWGEMWGDGGVFGATPLSGDRVYWYGTLPNEELASYREQGWKQAAINTFAPWHPGIANILQQTPEDAILAHELFDRKPEPVWSGRSATLVGDAAHPMLPFLGQGGCQALEDAVALADALGHHSSVAEGLLAYEHARTQRANRIVSQSHSIARLAQLDSAKLRKARDTAMRLLPKSFRLKQLDTVVGYEGH
ncbi:FAD-dependent oxidoreductase [Arthrobacter crystallopoietes BAB-32]|uniref:FAD-dependent oxidoreductase n=1 Tax=Arthrobacter crystallopoietes BAB-32 TaxID=1246476 RepID=N1V461_9MICC|nr:FAD-dependent monooxygenase [Arthrobacter crystallopoietes]EMY34779.1 FAD-dependent oxidoreductase [Arthrobacter crystallopoietes BAB-32]